MPCPSSPHRSDPECDSFDASRTAGAGGINGKTLTFTSFTAARAVNVTFGDGTGGSVKTLDQ